MPATFTLETRHVGSAGYVSTVEHRDIVVAPLLGLHSRSAERVRPVGVLGVGLVFARSSTTFRRTLFGGGLGEPTRPNQRNKQLPAVVGGLDVEIGLTPRVNVVMGIHGRKTWRRITMSDEVIGSFTLAAGAGIQFKM
jgi:hypothetical protein